MSGTMPPLKILVCFTWPAMTACVTPASCSSADAGAELSERDPVNRGPVPRGGAVQFGKRLFLGGDDRDVVPLRTRRVEDEERKGAVAGDQARDACRRYSSATSSSARRVGRRRMTPRCERADEVDERRAPRARSGSASRSIAASAAAGVQLRLQQIAVGRFSWLMVSGVKPRRDSPMLLTPKTRAGRLPMVRANGSASLVTTE